MIELNRKYIVKQYEKDDLNNLTDKFGSNELRKIILNAFKGLVKLETLVMDYNEIEEIEVGSFNSSYNPFRKAI